MKYPEHEKLARLQDEIAGAQALWDFIESEGVLLCRHEAGRHHPAVVRRSPASFIAGAFGIDERALEAEKRAMVEALRDYTGAHGGVFVQGEGGDE
jgi:hypothetical protein